MTIIIEYFNSQLLFLYIIYPAEMADQQLLVDSPI